jgi:hypothetical protein
MKKIYFLLIALLCSATMAFAYDAEIDGIYYDFDHENKTAMVVQNKEIQYEGLLWRTHEPCVPTIKRLLDLGRVAVVVCGVIGGFR